MKLTKSKLTETLRKLNSGKTVYHARKIANVNKDGKVDANDRIGIGLSSLNRPTTMLDVNGSTNINGGLNVTNVINTQTNFSVNNIQGITGNYTNGNCWMKFTGGILTATNCSSS